MPDFADFALLLGSVFPLLYLCAAVVFFLRFKTSPAGIIGTLGFLIWFVLAATRTVLIVQGIDIRPYIHGLGVGFLGGFAMILYGLATMSLDGAGIALAPPAAGRSARPRSVTVISIALMVLAVVGVGVVVVTGYLVEFDERFLPLLLVLLAAALLQAVFGAAMLYGQNWARWTFLILSPVSFAAALLSGKFSAGAIVQLVFWGVSVYFLTRPAASAYFGAAAAVPDASADENGREPAHAQGAGSSREPSADGDMGEAMDAVATILGNEAKGVRAYEVLKRADGGVTGVWVRHRSMLDNDAFLRTCLVNERLPEEVAMPAYVSISEGDYRIVDNPDAAVGGCFVMVGSAAAPFETMPKPDIVHWVPGAENPASRRVENPPGEGVVRFDCPTCLMPVYCAHEQMHGLVGAMVECTECGNISHVPAICRDPGQCDREPVRACVFVPISEFGAWYYAHPQCRDADPAHEAMYGLWTYCAGCKHDYVPSVLFAFATSDSVGGMVFNASTPESARDFEALRNGSCRKCNDTGLLALRLQIPQRVRVEIEDHLRGA